MPRDNTVIPFSTGVVNNTCGVGVWGAFRFRRNNPSTLQSPIATAHNLGGAGWLVASFTNDRHYREDYRNAYEQLKERFPIVYQSPVRTNRRTGRKFFFCVYDTNNR